MNHLEDKIDRTKQSLDGAIIMLMWTLGLFAVGLLAMVSTSEHHSRDFLPALAGRMVVPGLCAVNLWRARAAVFQAEVALDVHRILNGEVAA